MSIRGLEAAELLGYNVPEKESKAERKKEKKRSKTPERFEKSKKHSKCLSIMHELPPSEKFVE